MVAWPADSWPQQIGEPARQATRPFGGAAGRGFERGADDARANRGDERVRGKRPQSHTVDGSDFRFACHQQHVRFRHTQRCTQERRPRRVLTLEAHQKQTAAATERRAGRVEKMRCDRNEPVDAADACELSHRRLAAGAGSAPERREMRARSGGVLKHLGERRHRRPRDHAETAIDERQVVGRRCLRLRVSAARVGHEGTRPGRRRPDPTVRLARRIADRKAHCTQKTCRALLDDVGFIRRSTPHAAARPRLEARRLANEPEVEQPRHRSMRDRLQQLAPLVPSHLIGHAARGSDDDQRAFAGREINCVTVVADRKSICQ